MGRLLEGLRAFTRLVNPTTQTQIKEAVIPTPDTRVEDFGFRRVSSTADQMNLNPLDQNTLLKIVRALYYMNPGARRMIGIPVDYGFKVLVRAIEGKSHHRLQDIIDSFWNNPLNDMPRYIGQLLERFDLDGELLLPVKVNPQNGFVRISYEEPSEINKINAFSEDKRLVDTVEMVRHGRLKAKVYNIIRLQDDPESGVEIGSEAQGNLKQVNTYNKRMGNAFYFRQCNLITGRGRPPLEPVVDWLDAHDHALFDQLRNVSLQSAYVWDVELTGAGEAMINKRREEILKAGIPKPGSINVHNENEKWEPKSPQLEARVATDLLVQVRKYYGMGMSLSETWVAASDDVNRATAIISDNPPLRSLERKQFMEEMIIRDIIEFVIDQAIIHGELILNEDDPHIRDFEVVLPELNKSDDKAKAEALKILSEVALLAEEAEIADKETLRSLFYKVTGVRQPEDLNGYFEKKRPTLPDIKSYVSKRDLGDRNEKTQVTANDGLPKVDGEQ